MSDRQYQAQARTAIMGHWANGGRKPLIVMATGTGKTQVFCQIAREVVRSGKRVMIVAHRDELIRQAAHRASAIIGLPSAIEKADEFSDENSLHEKPPLVVTSVQTQVSGKGDRKRMQRFDPSEFGLLVFDEAHHATANTWMQVADHYLGNPECKLLGVTATPDRNDDRDLGRLFDEIVFRYELPDAVMDGYLVPLRQRSVVITGLDFSKVKTKRTPDGGRDFVESDLDAVMIAEKPVHQVASAAIEIGYALAKGTLHGLLDLPDDEARRQRLAALLAGAAHRPTLIFCVSVAHARLMADVLNRWLGDIGTTGAMADSVDGETDPGKRRDKFSAFRSGDRPFLANCQIATEGTDLPETAVVVVARPTKSRSLYAQMVGRGTRPIPTLADALGTLPDAESRRMAIAASSKAVCEILDFTDNSRRHDLVTTVDLIARPDIDAAVLEAAKAIADDRDVTAEDALAEAEEEVAVERAIGQLDAMAEEAAEKDDGTLKYEAWRRSLVGVADYEVSDGDGNGGHAGGNVGPVAKGGATEKQVAFLIKLGCRREVAEGYGKQQAGAVITSLKEKRCTVGQARWLRRLGYSESDVAGMNFDAACSAIDASKQEAAA